jgi:SAM-dependent methyltransferase
VEGIPVLLRDDVEQTIGIAAASLARGRGKPGSVDVRRPELYLESLGVSEDEKNLALNLADEGSEIDPAAAVLVAATNGIAYMHLVGGLRKYPLPEIRLPETSGQTLLDVGCSWGRWSMAAASKGYRVVGIDPSLGALMAARRVAKSLGLSAHFVCADARYLPFANGAFDNMFSYSVVQHFSKSDAALAVRQMSRVTRHGGTVLVQMPNRMGIRSQMHLAKRRYTEGRGFEVRYWTLSELQHLFTREVGQTEISVHCYFGLGLEPTDLDLMTRPLNITIRASEWLRRLSQRFPVLKRVADSVYVRAQKAA